MRKVPTYLIWLASALMWLASAACLFNLAGIPWRIAAPCVLSMSIANLSAAFALVLMLSGKGGE